MLYAHPRSLDYFGTEAALKSVLLKLMEGIDRYGDPVLGSDDATCVPWTWYGDVTKDGMPAIRVVKPGGTKKYLHLVDRTLAFIFANNEYLEQKINTLRKQPVSR